MPESFSQRLLAWYDSSARVFSFRGTKDPYRVWISEIMLQQTRTESVTPYYEHFLSTFPDIHTLAAAGEEDVLRCWQGLGYYSRARNLHKAAQIIVQEYGGRFPRTAEELRKLPGIGPYTAAAVASIAFDEPVPAMDGNLIRVFSRITDESEDATQPAVLGRLTETARAEMPADRPGDYNQALMDLGATICTPGTPDCARCPVLAECLASASGQAENRPVLPHRSVPKTVAMTVVMIFWNGKVYLQMREASLLKGMYVFALGEATAEQILKTLGFPSETAVHVGEARHVFTHRIWEMDLWTAHVEKVPDELIPHFYTPDQLERLPIPTAMRTALIHVRKELNHET